MRPTIFGRSFVDQNKPMRFPLISFLFILEVILGQIVVVVDVVRLINGSCCRLNLLKTQQKVITVQPPIGQETFTSTTRSLPVISSLI